jgi:hypothetical protein
MQAMGVRMFSQNDAVLATARLVAAFGDHRVADSGLMRLWLCELVEAFAGYTPERVNLALGAVIRRCKFWPTIAEIVTEVRGQTPPPTLPAFREPVEPDRTPEEVARRVAAVAAMKKKWGWDQKFRPEVPQAEDKPFHGFDTEVSDVSADLKNLMRKRNRT